MNFERPRNIKNHSKILLSASVVLMSFIGVFMFPLASAHGIKTGLIFCSDILIPSLFPFMVLSAFAVKSDLSHTIEKLLGPMTEKLFNLPGCTGTTILIGLVGGYPTGALGIKALVERGKICDEHAERMALFTVGAGPAFVISFIGIGLLGNIEIGCILFISQIVASLLLGIFLGVFSPKNLVPRLERQKTFPNKSSVSNSLIEACADSTYGLLNMCSLVILFSSFLFVIKQSQFLNLLTQFLINIGISNKFAESIIPIILEVTFGCKNAAALGISPVLISFALGWAGICVHFQIFSVLGDVEFSKIKFVCFRLIHGSIAAFISYFILLFKPLSITAFRANVCHSPFDAYSFTSGSLALILLCACFLSTLTPKIISFDKNEAKNVKHL